MRNVIDRASRDINQINIPLVQHVGKLLEHPAVWKVAGDDVATLLDEIAGERDPEQRRMRLEYGIVILEHGPTEAHECHLEGGTLVFNNHFLTISVMAERNWATSVNLR